MNTILLGPLLGNNRADLIKRCAELVAANQSHKFLYLAASHPLLEVVTEGILDGTTNHGVWGELPVYLFRGFVRRVLMSAIDSEGKNLTPRLTIDREELPLKRSLISQILARLKEQGKLKAIAPLAGREGCVNTLATLIGEIQRAAKTPDEVSAIIASRGEDFPPRSDSTISQIEFDNEVALIYSTYCGLLQQNNLTENDADQMRALAVLRGEVDGTRVQLPGLDSVELLILDGFFDFTPIQGEILREVIPRVTETLVNLNYDPGNPEIFAPFRETVDQLGAVAKFETKQTTEAMETAGALSVLRVNLFNPTLSDKLQLVDDSPLDAQHTQSSLSDDNDKLKFIEHPLSDKLQLVDDSSSDAQHTQSSLSDDNDKLKFIEHPLSDKLQLVADSPDQTPIAEGADHTDDSLNSNDDKLKHIGQSEIRYFECGDRDTEIRMIAKEVKRLVLLENYNLIDIALVVRQRDAYSKTIARVMRDEAVPCKLELRVDVIDVPATRAALKLLELLEQPASSETLAFRIADVADLIKSEYFRLSDEELTKLSAQFDSTYLALLSDDDQPLTSEAVHRAKQRQRIGFWNADALENAFAYVGSDLPVRAWLKRADKLIKELPAATFTKELLNIDAGSQDRDADIADQVENAETAKLEEKVEKKRRPSRDIHPAALAWTALVIQRFAELLVAVPRDGSPTELRLALTKLLEQFGFREQITRPTQTSTDEQELPQVMLNFNALESLRRAFVAAIKSIEMSDKLQLVADSPDKTLEDKDADQTDDSLNNDIDKLKHIEHPVSDKLQLIADSPDKTLEDKDADQTDDSLNNDIDKLKHIEHPVSDKLQLVADSPNKTLEAQDADLTDDSLNNDNDKLKHIGHLSTFIAEVRRSLNSQSQILGPADRNGLRVLEATDVRGLKFKAIFIAGLIEGGFPLRASRDWIYPHEERERLKKYGLTLEDISPATLLKEEHYFYQAVCRATERLYLSRPLLLEDDSETVASYYVDELRRAIAPLELQQESLRRDYDGKELDDASSAAELSVSLVRQQERHLHRGEKEKLKPQPRIKRLLTLARNDGFLSDAALRRIEIERERAGGQFGPYDGAITDPQLLELLQRKFGEEFVHSASGLSVFGNCPYRFFAQRVLKLEPRGEAALDLQAIDAGKLLHDILRRFFEQHRRQPLYSLDRNGLRNELLGLADRVFDEHERVVPPLNRQIWKIDREIRKILLEQVLQYELEIQEKAEENAVLPAFFEIAFGGTRSAARDPQSTDTALELRRATFVGDESIKISGQIDRVDLASDNTLVAYDYKLSVGSTKEDIRTGRSLQIPIYLEALEQLILPGNEVAGGGYYIIRGANDRRNKGLYRASKLDYYKLNARAGAVINDEEWQEIRSEVISTIWNFLDRMRAGKFFVNPSERNKTCKFCDFGAVCRYSRARIDAKRRSGFKD